MGGLLDAAQQIKPLPPSLEVTAEVEVRRQDRERVRGPQVILPSVGPQDDTVTVGHTAESMCAVLSAKGNFYTRGGAVHEYREMNGDGFLFPTTAPELCARFPDHFDLYVWRQHKDGPQLRPDATISMEIGKQLLASTPLRDRLRPINRILRQPGLVRRNGNLETLHPGYNPENGGTIVVKKEEIPLIAYEIACSELKALIEDFDFHTPSDRSRALATMLTPALRFGGLIAGNIPFNVVEATGEPTGSQTGKTYLVNMITAIYGEQASVVTQRKGGVGSFDESLSECLVKGSPFISIDNARGRIDSTTLESLVTPGGTYTARIPNRGSIPIDPQNFIFNLTSNGAEMTIDLANRFSVVRLRKRPPGYQWKKWELSHGRTGDVMAYIQENQLRLLGCIHAIVRHWHQAGSLSTQETRHSFREWGGILDWIVRAMGEAPLLDGHEVIRDRVSDPVKVWLRALALAICPPGNFAQYSASSLAEQCMRHELYPPPTDHRSNKESISKVIGLKMVKVFSSSDQIDIEGVAIKRISVRDKEHGKPRTEYIFTNLNPGQGPKFDVTQPPQMNGGDLSPGDTPPEKTASQTTNQTAINEAPATAAASVNFFLSTVVPSDQPDDVERWVIDIEVFPNAVIVVCNNGSREVVFTDQNFPELADFLSNPKLVVVGFNNFHYDDNILRYIVNYPSHTAADIYQLSKQLIDPQGEEDDEEGEHRANFKLRYEQSPWAYSIDVSKLLNGRTSLKEQACRMGFTIVVDSPVAFDAPLPVDRFTEVTQYCRNDVAVTAALLKKHQGLVEVRTTLAKEFDLDAKVYVQTEPQLAQRIFIELHKRRTGMTTKDLRDQAIENPENHRLEFPLSTLISPRVKFTTGPFQLLLAALRTGAVKAPADKPNSWSLAVPQKDFSKPVHLAGKEFQLGVGGLHSEDTPGVFDSDAETAIIDLDVTSYYPSIIIQERLFPPQLGSEFVEDMVNLRNQRVAAKQAGEKVTADALKIVINSTFGKLNDFWSPLRSVPDAHRVTINGQLFLLMLIERLHVAGAEILSANTDGVTIRWGRKAVATELNDIKASWEHDTGLALEKQEYRRICRRDVNNYLAVPETGDLKIKGAFNSKGTKMDGLVIKRAAEAYLIHGKDPAAFIADETDPVAFLFYQRCQANNVIHHGSTPIGRTARWYASKTGAPMNRVNEKGKASKLPNGGHAGVAMDITGWTRATLDPDLDVDFYVAAAWKLIKSVQGDLPASRDNDSE